MSETTLGSVFCSSCEGNHQDVEAKEYQGTPPGPYTHWFVCPKTNDAVPLTIKTASGTKVVINDKILTKLAELQQDEVYMVALFSVKPSEARQSSVEMFRLTSNFPTDHLNLCVDVLTKDLKKEIGPPSGGPMKVAAMPADPDEPLSRMFGNSRKLTN